MGDHEMIDSGLDCKIALITGANHGIGAATARTMAAQGAKVYVAYYLPSSEYTQGELEEARRSGVGGDRLYHAMHQQTGDAVADDIRSRGGIATAGEFDLGDASSIPRLFDACESELGPVDILVSNHTHDTLETFDPASVTEGPPPISLSNAESIDRHFAVNTRAGALMMGEYLQRYLDRKAESGRIVSLTTVLAHSRNISYAASKRALVSYSLSAAQEMGKYGITANVVCPGATQTGYITPEDEARIIARTPLARVGSPEDAANVITFLASEQGKWITGQVIYSAGGFMMYPQ